jgi:hypothetical protein
VSFRAGDHVRVGPTKPDGTPHPQAGKTGKILEVMGIFPPAKAQIVVDPGIEPQGIIVVTLTSLERIEP